MYVFRFLRIGDPQCGDLERLKEEVQITFCKTKAKAQQEPPSLSKISSVESSDL
jgi:hypothetical protein